MKKMNLPNKLTLLRIILVPAVIAAILIDFPFHFLVGGILFGIAAITDALDGRIARRDNLITDFGKFADPLADKILVISVMVCFVKLNLCGAIPLIIIIFREFAVTSIRLVAAAKGKVIAANMWGKVKTVTQIIAIVSVFLMQFIFEILERTMTDAVALLHIYDVFNAIGQVMFWIVAVITVISGVIYLKDNKDVISDM
ncbi:CDP-diacylglycerol--glycerol-3-phosphate 3-phosphatidyltransferase [uncultured Ruminococcus sp.]|uniref:CDP-diacylglycerol--glycerol-3-phosphate 3-phosphatidyltransferase n=1 Tax=uncultured Ruminococcus sp. TaxID=165186 RepID=UPI002930FF90|nr:CDP-diacylglycerol--glycerol-3-phosphate 3-phosphatidyltransferase [uncultured Ruminococcus sp.]